MKLYKVPQRTKIRVLEEPSVPPGAPPVKKGDIIKFIRTDGRYSYCYNIDGDVVHLGVTTEVEVIKNGEEKE